jgi:hypothetical protein
MSKVEKITPEELVELQEFVGKLNQVQMELGKLELQKNQAISAYAEVQTSMREFQKGLEEVYGQVSINIEDGAITVPEAEEVTEGE